MGSNCDMKKMVALLSCIMIVCAIPMISLAKSDRTNYYNVKFTRQADYCSTEIYYIDSVCYTVRTRQVLASRTGKTNKGDRREVKNGDRKAIKATDNGSTSSKTYHNSAINDSTGWYGASLYMSKYGYEKHSRDCI